MASRCTIIVDASHCPDTKASGWGAWIRFNQTQCLKKSGTFKKRPVNSTQAELWACLNSIHIAMQFKKDLTQILIQNDCMEVIQKLNTRKFIKRYINDTITLKARHVKGHTSRTEARFWVNRWCDSVAKVHMRTQRLEFRGVHSTPVAS